MTTCWFVTWPLTHGAGMLPELAPPSLPELVPELLPDVLPEPPLPELLPELTPEPPPEPLPVLPPPELEPEPVKSLPEVLLPDWAPELVLPLWPPPPELLPLPLLPLSLGVPDPLPQAATPRHVTTENPIAKNEWRTIESTSEHASKTPGTAHPRPVAGARYFTLCPVGLHFVMHL